MSTFACTECGRAFGLVPREPDAAADEFRRNFPTEAAAGAPSRDVCDDCYARFIATIDKRGPR